MNFSLQNPNVKSKPKSKFQILHLNFGLACPAYRQAGGRQV
jgi:hypothetical protein